MKQQKKDVQHTTPSLKKINERDKHKHLNDISRISRLQLYHARGNDLNCNVLIYKK